MFRLVSVLVLLVVSTVAQALSPAVPTRVQILQLHGKVTYSGLPEEFVIQVDRIRAHPGAREVLCPVAKSKTVAIQGTTRFLDPDGNGVVPASIVEGKEVEVFGINEGTGSVLRAEAVVVYTEPSRGWSDPAKLGLFAQPDRTADEPYYPEPPSSLRGEGVVKYLRELIKATEATSIADITMEEICRSGKGKPIVAITISSAQQPPAPTARVLVVAAQHGDEPAGTRAMIELVRQFALTRDQSTKDLLGKVTLYIIPIANPDGAASFKRRTAGGKDLNRDWDNLSSAESRAITDYLGQCKPDVLMDLHEQPPISRASACAVGLPKPAAGSLLRAIQAAFSKHNIHVPVRFETESKSTRLLHRQFAAAYGKPAILIESKYRRSPGEFIESRSSIHLVAVMAVVKALASDGARGGGAVATQSKGQRHRPPIGGGQ